MILQIIETLNFGNAKSMFDSEGAEELAQARTDVLGNLWLVNCQNRAGVDIN